MESYDIIIVGAGPGGLSAAAHAVSTGQSHVLLEASDGIAHTVQRYQKGKHVMAEPSILPLRSDLPFEPGSRESILEAWHTGVTAPGTRIVYNARVSSITGERGDFTVTTADGGIWQGRHVILAIGVQGNLRKLGVPGEDLPFVQYQLDDPDEYENESIVVVGAGDAAIDATQRTEDALYEAADILDVSPEEVPETAERFFEEWKARGKEIDELKAQLAEARASGGADAEEVEVAGTTAVIQRIDADMDELRAQANAIVEQGKIAVLGSGSDGATFVVAVPDGVEVNAGQVVGELAGRVGGGGGGPPDFAQGGGPDADKLDAAIADAPEILQGVTASED